MLHVWNIYLQHWAILGVNVGKYSSTMEHLGISINYVEDDYLPLY